MNIECIMTELLYGSLEFMLFFSFLFHAQRKAASIFYVGEREKLKVKTDVGDYVR